MQMTLELMGRIQYMPYAYEFDSIIDYYFGFLDVDVEGR